MRAGVVSLPGVRARRTEASTLTAGKKSPRAEPLTLAVDLSLTTDLSALALATEVGDVARVAVEFWTPADTLRARADRDAIDYPLWVRQGYLNAVPGSTLDYTVIARRIAEIASKRQVKRVVFDRYKMPYLRNAMQELGLDLELVEHPQTFVRLKGSTLWMPESINQVESAVLEGTVQFWRNPVLTWCAASAVVNIDEQGSRTFSKRKSTGRIDGLVAATMAIGALRTPQPEVDIAAWIVSLGSGRIMADQIFTLRIPVASTDAANVAAAMDQGASTVMTEIVAFVARKL